MFLKLNEFIDSYCFYQRSNTLYVAYLKRVEARKSDRGDSPSLAQPSGPTPEQMSVEGLKHLSDLADIKVRKFSISVHSNV